VLESAFLYLNETRCYTFPTGQDCGLATLSTCCVNFTVNAHLTSGIVHSPTVNNHQIVFLVPAAYSVLFRSPQCSSAFLGLTLDGEEVPGTFSFNSASCEVRGTVVITAPGQTLNIFIPAGSLLAQSIDLNGDPTVSPIFWVEPTVAASVLIQQMG
jgi:hypothetical protein